MVLEIPQSEFVMMQFVLLQVFEEAVMLLGTNLPFCPPRSESVVFCLDDRCIVENMSSFPSKREPAMKSILGRAEIQSIELIRTFPRRQRRRAPVDARLVTSSNQRFAVVVYFGEIWLNRAKIPMDPAEERLVDDVGGNNVIFRVR